MSNSKKLSQVTVSPAFTSSTSFSTRFACMSLNFPNRIRLINFVEEDVLAITGAIQETGTPGLKLKPVQDFGESREIQLQGRPWAPCYHGKDNARRLLLGILNKLYARGWIFAWAVNITRGRQGNLIFRKQWPPPQACERILMSFDGLDKIKIINPYRDLTNAMLETLGDEVQDKSTPERFKVHIQGRPWKPSNFTSVETSSLLLRLVQTLESRGFTIYEVIGNKGGGTADMLVCQRSAAWVRGDQIVHR